MEQLVEILNTFKWPITVLIGSLIFRKPFVNLIDRVKTISKSGIDTSGSVSQGSKTPSSNESDKSKSEQFERALHMFSDDTIQRFIDVVTEQSGIDECTNDQEKVDNLINYSKALLAVHQFEQIYYQIHGSQIKILLHLNSTNQETVGSVKVFYDTATEQYPTQYKGYDFDDYFQFLIEQQLVSKDENDILNITWFGRDFLKYIIDQGRTDLKLY